MDRRIRWMENELTALSNSLQAAQFVLDAWKQNEERGNEPAIPEPSIISMKGFARSMRQSLDNIDGILDSTGE